MMMMMVATASNVTPCPQVCHVCRRPLFLDL
jgi:hypothetical protein